MLLTLLCCSSVRKSSIPPQLLNSFEKRFWSSGAQHGDKQAAPLDHVAGDEDLGAAGLVDRHSGVALEQAVHDVDVVRRAAKIRTSWKPEVIMRQSHDSVCV